MNQPLPLPLKRATVRIAGDVITVSAHELHIKHRVPRLMADAIWERMGTKAGTVSVELSAPMATAELERGGLRIRFGPLSVVRPLLHSWWRFLYSRELAEKGVAHVA